MKRRVARLQLQGLDLIDRFDAFDIGEVLQKLPDDTKLINFSNDINTNTLSMVLESPAFQEIEEYAILPLITILDDDLNLDLSQVLDPLNSGQALQILNNVTLPNQTSFITPRRGYQITPNGKFWNATSKPLNTDELKRVQEEINRLNTQIQNSIKDMAVPKIFIDTKGKDYKTIKKEHDQMKCNHTWATYTGLNHTDTYCTKCAKVK